MQYCECRLDLNLLDEQTPHLVSLRAKTENTVRERIPLLKQLHNAFGEHGEACTSMVIPVCALSVCLIRLSLHSLLNVELLHLVASSVTAEHRALHCHSQQPWIL